MLGGGKSSGGGSKQQGVERWGSGGGISWNLDGRKQQGLRGVAGEKQGCGGEEFELGMGRDQEEWGNRNPEGSVGGGRSRDGAGGHNEGFLSSTSTNIHPGRRKALGVGREQFPARA